VLHWIERATAHAFTHATRTRTLSCSCSRSMASCVEPGTHVYTGPSRLGQLASYSLIFRSKRKEKNPSCLCVLLLAFSTIWQGLLAHTTHVQVKPVGTTSAHIDPQSHYSSKSSPERNKNSYSHKHQRQIAPAFFPPFLVLLSLYNRIHTRFVVFLAAALFFPPLSISRRLIDLRLP
jgi:hypothetical protein